MGHFEQLCHFPTEGEIASSLSLCLEFIAPCILREQANNGYIFHTERKNILKFNRNNLTNYGNSIESEVILSEKVHLS
jgi:hypothetical protein